METRLGIAELVERLEQRAQTLIWSTMMHRDYLAVKDHLSLPTISSSPHAGATRFRRGTGYWSVNHFDNGFYLTVLSVLSAKCRDNTKIIYYVCFTQYEIAISLKSGDVLVFNPLALRSCVNPRMDSCYIFSAYVSNKTVMTEGIRELMN